MELDMIKEIGSKPTCPNGYLICTYYKVDVRFAPRHMNRTVLLYR